MLFARHITPNIEFSNVYAKHIGKISGRIKFFPVMDLMPPNGLAGSVTKT